MQSNYNLTSDWTLHLQKEIFPLNSEYWCRNLYLITFTAILGLAWLSFFNGLKRRALKKLLLKILFTFERIFTIITLVHCIYNPHFDVFCKLLYVYLSNSFSLLKVCLQASHWCKTLTLLILWYLSSESPVELQISTDWTGGDTIITRTTHPTHP